MAERDLTAELRHRRQHRKTTTTILVVLLMLFFAFWYAFSYYRSASDPDPDSGRSTGGTPACRPFDPKVATPANTTVNVYNATSRSGLAARTASQLRSRGFLIGKVANDPLGRKVAGPAEVRFGPAGSSRAQLVLPLGGKGTTQLPDKRTNAVVDLVVGATFTSLAAAPTATGTPMCPAPTTASATPTPAG